MKTNTLYFLILFVFIASFSHAEEPTRESIAVNNAAIEKEIPSYRMSLQRLIKEAEMNLKKVDKEIKKQENANLARKLLEEGNALYKEDNLKGAQQKWQDALKITKDPSFKKYLKENEKRFKKEAADAAHAKKLQDKKNKAAASRAKIEEKKRKIAEAKKQKTLEKARKKAERKALLESNKKANAKPKTASSNIK